MTATLGNIINLIDASLKAPLITQTGESLNIIGQLVDMAGDDILLGGLSTFVLTVFNEADSALVNSINAANIKNVGRGTVDAGGAFVIRLDPDDTPIIDGTLADNAIEDHIARLTWTWNDGVAVRTGIQEVRHRIQKLPVPA